MPRTPKGASSASESKAAKINSTQLNMQKGRRSHDPNRSLASLPVSRIINNVYSFADNQMMSKALMIVLATLADLNERTLPTGIDNFSTGSRPIIKSFNDIIQWVKKLTFDNGFLIVSLTGSTGMGRCVSRGPYSGKSIHITSGGLTYSNKRGTHILLCGTISDRAAHAFVDLSDPFVQHVIPALVHFGVIMLDDNKHNEDDGLIFEEEDEIGNDISYALIVDMGKVINPKLIFKKIHHKKAVPDKPEKVEKRIVVNDKEDYMATMELPSSGDEDEYEVENEDNSVAITKKSKFKSRTINLNSQIQEEDDDDDDEYDSDD